MALEIDIQGNKIEVQKKDSEWTLNGVRVQPDLIKTDDTTWHLILNGHSYRITLDEMDPSGKFALIQVNGKSIRADITRPLDKLLKEMGLDDLSTPKANDMKAPMPGLIREVKVKAGDIVQAGDPVLILEAMKMENVLKAPGQVSIKSVLVSAGDKVDKNAVLVTFE